MTAIAVTGATGHVGNNLIRALLDKGRTVRAFLFDGRANIAGLPVEIVPGDVLDLDSLRRAFTGVGIVYHTAARISISRHDRPLVDAINIRGTRNVIQACLDCGVRRLVHFSSIHAYVQEPLLETLDESRPLVAWCNRRLPPYDRSKAAGERLVRAAGRRRLETVILNPTGIIGPYDFGPSFFGRVLSSLGRGRMPLMVGGGFDWVDVRDVVAAAVTAENAPAGGRYLLSGRWIANRELSAMAATIGGVKPPRAFIPLSLARLGAPAAAAWSALTGRTALYTDVALRDLRGNRRISHEKAAAELGFNPRPLRETIADTLAWFAGRQ